MQQIATPGKHKFSTMFWRTQMNRFARGMAMGMMAGVAVGAAAEMWMLASNEKKSKMVRKGKRVLNDMMD